MRRRRDTRRRLLTWLVLAALLGAAPAAVRAEPSGPTAPVPMEVADVLPAGNGTLVVLRTRQGTRYLPIWIGESEGLAIALRLARRRAPRPLTHDLLEHVIRSLNARLVKVHIEAVRHSTFLGRIYLRQGGRQLSLDARPSDSIALALGAGAPIYALRRVLDQAGVSRSQLPVPPTQSGGPGVGGDPRDDAEGPTRRGQSL